MVNKRFSISFLLLVIATTALLLAIVLIPGLYAFYVPVFVLLVLAIFCIREIKILHRERRPLSLAGYWKLGVALLVLIVVGLFFGAIADFAANYAFASADLHQRTRKFEAVIKGQNPVRTRKELLDLLEKCVAQYGLPDSEHEVDAPISELPGWLSELEPQAVRYGENYIRVVYVFQGYYSHSVFEIKALKNPVQIRSSQRWVVTELTRGLWICHYNN